MFFCQATVNEILQGPEESQAESSFKIIIDHIAVSGTFCASPSQKQCFCWSVVGNLCQNESMPSLQHVKRLPRHYKETMKLCGCLYVCYYHQRSSSTEIVKTELPNDLPTLLPPVRTFFEWTCKIHNNMLGWKIKLTEKRINHMEVMTYKSCYSDLKDLMGAFCSEDYVFGYPELEALVAEFDGISGKVSNILIKRITDSDSRKFLW